MHKHIPAENIGDVNKQRKAPMGKVFESQLSIKKPPRQGYGLKQAIESAGLRCNAVVVTTTVAAKKCAVFLDKYGKIASPLSLDVKPADDREQYFEKK